MGRPVIVDPGGGGGGGLVPAGPGFRVAGVEIRPGTDMAFDVVKDANVVVIRSTASAAPPAPGGLPAGVIAMWGAAAAPTGYLLCDGASYATADYADLFGAIGYAYGGAGASFNVPNLKGRVPVGLDSGQAEFDALAETGGAKTHTLASGEMPSHTHTQDAHTHTQDAHTHTQNSHNHTQDPHTHSFLPRSATTGAVSSIVTGTLDTSSTISGSNQPHIQNATATNQAATAVNQNATATNQAATATNQNTGGGGAHNNLQPYLVVHFIIKT